MTVAVDDAPAPTHERSAARGASSGNGCCRPSTSACAPGSGEFLAELRPAYPLFVRFGGIDYDNDDDAIAKLDDFVRRAQRIVATYGGNLLQLTLGDKGAYLYAVFGPPLRARGRRRARRGRRARAARARVHDRGHRHPDRHHVRPACAAARTATSGGRRSPASATRSISRRDSCRRRRRGRSMSRNRCVAPPATSFTWEQLAPMTVKGKAEPVSVFALTGSKRHASRKRADSELPIVGRRAELDTLAAKLDEALAGSGQRRRHLRRSGHGQVAAGRGVRADGGTRGASRRRRRVPVVRHEHELLRLARDLVDAFRPRRQRCPKTSRSGRSRPSSRRSIPRSCRARRCSAGSSTCPIPDNDLTARSTRSCARRRSKGCSPSAFARGRPRRRSCSCSRTATGSIRCRAICSRCSPARCAGLRVLLVLAYRPGSERRRRARPREPAAFRRDRARPSSTRRTRRSSSARSSRRCSAPRRSRRRRSSSSSPRAPRAIRSTSRSCSTSSAARASIRRTRRRSTKLELPESLHSLILSRIDMLARGAAAHAQGGERHRPRVPRADAAGRLPGARSARRGRASTCATLGASRPRQRRRRKPSRRTSSSTSSRRRSRTRACRSRSGRCCTSASAHYIETTEADAIDRNLDLLAHHYWHSENLPKKREYLRPRRRRGAGGVRERGGDRLLRAAGAAGRGGRARRRAAQARQGARARRQLAAARSRSSSEALALAEELGDDHATRVVRDGARRGRAQAGPLRRGARAARSRGARVSSRWATRAASAGCCTSSARSRRSAATTTKAVENYEASLAIRERTGDKASMGSLLSNLGIVAEYRGDYERSRALARARARAAHRDRRPLGDRQLDELPRHDRRRCRSATPRRATGSRSRCCSTARSATPGWSRSATTTSATRRGASATTRRPADTMPTACAPTATTTTGGRSRSCSRTSACSPR